MLELEFVRKELVSLVGQTEADETYDRLYKEIIFVK
jgi:hypothetical protein